MRGKSAFQDIRQALSVSHLKGLCHRRITQVAVDQQHTVSPLCHRQCCINRNSCFSLSGNSAGNQNDTLFLLQQFLLKVQTHEVYSFREAGFSVILNSQGAGRILRHNLCCGNCTDTGAIKQLLQLFVIVNGISGNRQKQGYQHPQTNADDCALSCGSYNRERVNGICRYSAFIQRNHDGRADYKFGNLGITSHNRVQNVHSMLRIPILNLQGENIGALNNFGSDRRNPGSIQMLFDLFLQCIAGKNVRESFLHLLCGLGIIADGAGIQWIGYLYRKGNVGFIDGIVILILPECQCGGEYNCHNNTGNPDLLNCMPQISQKRKNINLSRSLFSLFHSDLLLAS